MKKDDGISFTGLNVGHFLAEHVGKFFRVAHSRIDCVHPLSFFDKYLADGTKIQWGRTRRKGVLPPFRSPAS